LKREAVSGWRLAVGAEEGTQLLPLIRKETRIEMDKRFPNDGQCCGISLTANR
jgi:hypothetical protein